MADSRVVRCQDCGHEWDCSAEYPQCSDPNGECGRSRNVEPVNGSDSDSPTPEESESRSSENRGTADGSESQSDDSNWSPLFEAENTETDPIESPAQSLGTSDSDDPTASPEDDTDSVEFGGGEMPALDGDDIRMFVKTPFDMAASSRGEHWELSDNELDQLSESYARVANKWGPSLMGEYGPEILAAMTTMAVVGPRVAEDKKQADDRQESSTDDEKNAATERTDTEPDTPDAPGDEIATDNFAFSQV